MQRLNSKQTWNEGNLNERRKREKNFKLLNNRKRDKLKSHKLIDRKNEETNWRRKLDKLSLPKSKERKEYFMKEIKIT
jgi:hypothetical protein